MTFTELGLSQPILDAIGARGFETPTPIQERTIPALLTGNRDIMGLAQTGTGKTAAFGLPILERLDFEDRRTQALVLCPTRELCLQVSREIADYGRNIQSVRIATVYGGASFGPQIRDLKAGAPIVVATPGRLKDLLDKGVADLSGLRRLVLDEADQMLDMGFKDELDAILEAASPDRQTLLFSATMPPLVARIAREYMTDPEEIVAGERNKATDTVTHTAYRVHAADKYAALRRLIDVNTGMYAIIFCRTREGVKEIAHRLGRDGYAVDSLHGELSQVQRESVMRRFRDKNPTLLVATDVAARGLDVDDLTHVIHYDLPDDPEVYNHRSGRTGRAGRKGQSLILGHLREGYRIGRIERTIGRKIVSGSIPGGKEVVESRLLHLVEKITGAVVDEEAIAPYLSAVEERLATLDRDDLIRHFVTVELGLFLEEYGDAKDLNPPPPPKRREFDGPRDGNRNFSRESGGQYVWIWVNIGRRDGVLPPDLIALVNQACRTRGIRLGRIDIAPNFSTFQVESAKADFVEQSLKGFVHKGRTLESRPGTPGRGPTRRGGGPRQYGEGRTKKGYGPKGR